MGGKSTSDTTTSGSTTGTLNSVSGFGSDTAPTVQSILGALNPQIANSGLTSPQQTAINQLTNNGLNGNPYAGQEQTNAGVLLNGGGANNNNQYYGSNWQNLASNIGGTANPNYSMLNSPAVQQALATANRDVTDQVNGSFAAAGRGGSAYNTEALGRGIAAAQAPIILGQANIDKTNQMNAASTLFNAGNTTLGNINNNNQTDLSNRIAGINAGTGATTAANQGPEAAIQAQLLGQSIPAQNLGLLAQIGIPIAGMNGTRNINTTGTSNTTSDTSSQMSGAQQFQMIMSGLGNLIPKGPLTMNFGG